MIAMVERITDHPLLRDERLVGLGLAYMTAGVDVHAWARRARVATARSHRGGRGGRRVSFNEAKLVSVREFEFEAPPEPVLLPYKATPRFRHSALSLFIADHIAPNLMRVPRATETKRLAKEFGLLEWKDKAAADALAARAKALNDALPSGG